MTYVMIVIDLVILQGCDNPSHADLLQQIKNLKAKCSKYESTIAGQNLMMKELTTLNMELQRDVIQYFKEFRGTHTLFIDN